MRRDLTRGCAACRLRYSSRLSHCPVCRHVAMTVHEAINQVQPTSRAAWLVKWVLVLSVIPAIFLIGAAGVALMKEGWPPKNALDVLIGVLGTGGACLGASVAVAIPFALWYALIRVVGFVLKLLVDRPRRTLRVTIELAGRPLPPGRYHRMHELWDKLETFVRHLIKAPAPVLVTIGILFLSAEALAEIFGDKPFVKTTSWGDFGSSLVSLAFINFMGAAVSGIFLSVFGTGANAVKDFLDKPPHLFGYNPNPPSLQNEAALEKLALGRHAVIGRVERLDEIERNALGERTSTQLTAPLSGQTCLAFRLVGEANGQPVDDGDASAFVVVNDEQRRCIVKNTDVVVAIEADTKTRAENARGFLEARGLAERNLSLREGLLQEGDIVRVVGRTSDIRLGSAGYRSDDRRMVLDADDGLPVVIQTSAEVSV